MPVQRWLCLASVIRPYRPADLGALYDICLRTGASGSDASNVVADPRLFGDVYAAPYAALEPELAFVVEDDDGVAGYVLGALDTDAFAARCEREWWPALRAAHPEGSGARAVDQILVSLIHHPHRRAAAVIARFPSHLHIDLLPRVQGHGWGRRLLDTEADALRAAGSPGLHFGVGVSNERALAFYRHLGYEAWGSDGVSITFTRAL
jgi:ribosomal protein S18 acetylase RimI-like enzyme